MRNTITAAAVTSLFAYAALAMASPGEPSLAEVRAATERFQDVEVALAEGYVRDPGNLCDTADMMGKPAALGAMGIHFFRPDLLGISGPPNPRVDGTGTHTDFRKPAILIYEPQADGSLRLAAVENLVFAKAWHAAGNKRRPSFHGVPYDAMKDDPATAIDEAHMFEPALRSPRLAVPRQSQWHVRPVQSEGQLPGAQGWDGARQPTLAARAAFRRGPPSPTSPRMQSDAELKRLHWRAHHRGTREADMLVGGFFDAHHQDWGAADRALFGEMLEEQDVDIMAWAIGTQPVPERFRGPMTDALKKLDYIRICR